MPKYVIEREIPGAGNMNSDELRAAAQNSNAVLMVMGPEIQWVQSYVTGDKIYCVYIAPNSDLIRHHAEKADIPANSIARIATVIDPTTAEG